MPWAQPRFSSVDLNRLLGHSVDLSQGGLFWSSDDQSPDGAAQFNTRVAIAPSLTAEHAESAFMRAFSMYLLSKLDDNSLKEAFESLSEIYRWQIESADIVVNEPTVHYLGAFKPRLVKREPFTLDR